MSVNVPIKQTKKGRTRKFRRAQQLKQITTDIQFYHNLFTTKKIFVDSIESATGGELIIVAPPIGTTFYFLKCSVSNAGATAQIFKLTNTSAGITQTNREVLQVLPDTSIDFKMPLDMCVGDGTAQFAIEMENNIQCGVTLMGWFENTEEI